MQPTKKTKSSKTSSGPGAKATAPGAVSGSTAAPSKSKDVSNKNTKESFQKKLLQAQKTYDFKVEATDVKGKTERLNAINELS